MKSVMKRTTCFTLSLVGCLTSTGCHPERLLIKGTNTCIIDAKRVRATHEFVLNTDVRKALYVAGRAATVNWVNSSGGAFIYGEADKKNMNNFIFKENTSGDILFHSSQMTTFWYITAHNDHMLHALLVNDGIGMGKYEIECQGLENGKTSVSINFLYTAITDKGNQLMDEQFERNMSAWVDHMAYAIEKEIQSGDSSTSPPELSMKAFGKQEFNGKRVVVTHTETAHVPPENEIDILRQL